MEALDRYTFEQWQVAHSEYLDTKFNAVCNKIDGLKEQRLEDCSRCETNRVECLDRLDEELDGLKASSRKTTKVLAAGIALSVLVCLVATKVIPVGLMWKALGGFIKALIL